MVLGYDLRMNDDLEDLIWSLSADELWVLYDSGTLSEEDAEIVLKRYLEERETEAIIAAGR